MRRRESGGGEREVLFGSWCQVEAWRSDSIWRRRKGPVASRSGRRRRRKKAEDIKSEGETREVMMDRVEQTTMSREGI